MMRLRRSGITLAHMLTALVLLAGFSLAATYLLKATLRTSHASREVTRPRSMRCTGRTVRV